MSDIVLRWVMNNASARCSPGKVESEVFNEGGFRWTAAIERPLVDSNNWINFSLLCAVDHNDPWNCEAEVGVRVLTSNGTFEDWAVKKRFSPNAQSSSWHFAYSNYWNYFTHSFYNINNTVTFEFPIRIISSERGQPNAGLFAAENEMSNVILIIGDERLHVSKEYLSVHSPVFKTMFFGDFVEKDMKEVELKEVVYKEFLDLLQLIYVRKMDITDWTVSHILKLADMFEIKHIMEFSVKHLMQSNGIDVVKKLLLADKYNLVSITDHCFKSFTTSAALTGKITASPEFAIFSDRMKIAICERIAELSIKA